LARYNSDGSLDDSFGNNGKVTTDVNTGTEEFNRIKLQSDGNILAIGTSGDDFALARYVSADRASADQINGTAANDTLNGTSTDDVINGLAGNDILIGGGGNDTLTGGDGNDKFSFIGGKLPPDRSITAILGTDTITDFTAGDKIVLSKQIFSTLEREKGRLNKPDFATVADDSLVADKSAKIVYSQSSGALSYNANGQAAGLGNEGGIFATLTGLPTLTANDFTVVIQ
jgi:Ca2+-binding RTX toxin-like protein